MITPNRSPSVQVTRVERPNAPGTEVHQNPLLRVHLMLYGRYKWAIALGLVMGVCAAVLVWILTPPKYQVTGYVRINPAVESVFNNQTVLPMFETFVSLQVSLLESQRVLQQANLNAGWMALNKNSGHDGRQISADALTVDHPKNSEIITVAVVDRDPDVAAAAVKAILQTYKDTSGETNGESDVTRTQILEDLRTSLTNQKRVLGEQILAIATTYGTEDLQGRHQIKLSQQDRLEEELQQIALDISVAQAVAGTSATAPAATQVAVVAPTTQRAPLTREDVARIDLQMRDDLAEETRLALRLNQLRSKLGENHPQVLSAQTDLSFMKEQINALLASYQARGMEAPSISALPGADHDKLSLAELRAREAYIRPLFDTVLAEAKAVGQDELKIRKFKDDEETVAKKLDETAARIDQLTMDAKASNRISIMSDGEKPTAPLPSKRIPMTAGVGLLGFAAGAALVALRGFADRRVSCLLHMQQIAPSIPMLGMLPILPDDLADPAQVALTAHCVHQIRNMLDNSVSHEKGKAFAITSPAAGDGKTSLSLALGLSFAVSGSRTLLIDFDMIGGGLSSRLNAITRRRIGGILERKGLLTEQQAREALRVAADTHQKFGETLVALGYLKASDLQQALVDQQESSVGLLEALSGEPLAACIAPVVTDGLFVLPLGNADSANVSQISAKALRRIIKDARNQFEFIIIDTGPILGSVEASAVVREVDEVVLAVTRGSSSPLVTKTMELLTSLGARLGGVVFNRATSEDVAYSKYTSSGRTLSSSGQRRSQSRDAKGAPPRLGPVAAAVATAGVWAMGEPAAHLNGSSPKPHLNGNGDIGKQEPSNA